MSWLGQQQRGSAFGHQPPVPEQPFGDQAFPPSQPRTGPAFGTRPFGGEGFPNTGGGSPFGPQAAGPVQGPFGQQPFNQQSSPPWGPSGGSPSGFLGNPPRRRFPVLAVAGIAAVAGVIVVTLLTTLLPGREVSGPPPTSTSQRPRREVTNRPRVDPTPTTTQRPTQRESAPETTAPRTTGPETTRPGTSPPPTRRAKRPEKSLPPPKTAGWKTLANNPLYGVQLSEWSCPAMIDPVKSTDRDFPRYAKEAIGCMEDRWTEVLGKAGLGNDVVDLVFYEGQAQTPCSGGAPSSGGFYCPVNDVIYLDRARIASRDAYVRLGTLELLFHEYGHHVQFRAGISSVADDGETVDESSDQLARRSELQNSCMVWMQLGLATTGWSETDEEEFRDWATDDAGAKHGTGKSNTYWFNRGYGRSDLGLCNTWTADKSTVT